MASSTQHRHRDGGEWEVLNAQAWRLERAYQAATGPVDLEEFASLPGSPLRLRSLHELIKTDLELRWKAHSPVILEDYLARYRELGPADKLDPELIYEEYRVRNLFGDHPGLDLYQRRFPAQMEQLRHLLEENPLPPTRAERSAPPPEVRTAVPPTLPPSDPLANAAPAEAARTGDHILPSEGYTLGEFIGGGQFGEVYRARAPGGGEVAVKLIRRQLSHVSSQRELQALELIRSLRHIYLLQTHAYWSLKDRLIIVLELADDSLHDWINQCLREGLEGVPVNELLTFFRETAEVLDFLHANNVTHRDVKPANLLRLGGHAKVADFGLARLQRGSLEEATIFGGTLLYMAPECFGKKVSIHSDQYSLAMTYAEARLCRRILHGESLNEILHEHVEGTPDLTGMDEAEQQVVLKALAKDPDQRYPSCREFVQALSEAVLAAAPSTLPPPLPPPRLPRRLLLACGLVEVLVVVLVLAYFMYRAVEPGRRLPPGFQANPDRSVMEVSGSKRYYQHIRYPLPRGADPLEFVLIPRRQTPTGQAVDPFYVSRNKVTFEQFRARLDDPKMKELLERYTVRGRPAGDNWNAVKRRWEKGAWFTESQAKHPVVGITVTEAECFAESLGCKLPTALQWDAAGGRWDGDIYPCGEGWQPRPEFADVGTDRQDQSRFGCTDMSGNGREWLRDIYPEGSGTVPLADPSEFTLVQRRGNARGEHKRFSFQEVIPGGGKGPKPLLTKYGEAPDDTGFRIVLEINAPH